jgi:hypothetical protein
MNAAILAIVIQGTVPLQCSVEMTKSGIHEMCNDPNGFTTTMIVNGQTIILDSPTALTQSVDKVIPVTITIQPN